MNIVGEFMTDVSSWRLLVCYLDAAAGLGVTHRVPPDALMSDANVDRLAEAASHALALGLPCRREVWAAAMFVEANKWLNKAGLAAADDVDPLRDAAVLVEALCPEHDRPTALQLLDAGPLLAERERQRRRHPIRAFREPSWPLVVAHTTRQQSLWWQRAEHTEGKGPMVHAAAGIAAGIWSRLDAVHDPIGIREELRRRGDVEAGPWSLYSDLPAVTGFHLTGGIPPVREFDRRHSGKPSHAGISVRPAPTLRPAAGFTVFARAIDGLRRRRDRPTELGTW